MQKKAWCSECGHYVLITSEGICPVGHPRPALRGVEDVPDDYVLPDPPAPSAVPAGQSPPSPPTGRPDDYLGGFPGPGDIELANEILEAPMVLDESRLRRLIGIPVLAAVVMVAIAASWVVWFNFKYSPAYCLAQVSIGVQERNWNRVNEYVDVDSVVTSAMDSAAAGLTRNDPPSYVTLVSNVAKMTSPYVAEKAEDAFRKSVERGSSSTTEPAGSLRDMLSVMSLKKVTYDRKGALATVGVRRASGAQVDLGIRMRRDFFTRRWRITAIENILDLGAGASARSNLTPVGTTAKVGDWDVRVVRVTRKASDALYEPNNAAHMSRAEERREFAEYGYLVVTMHATYRGKERTGHFMRDLTPKLVTVRGTTSNSSPGRVPTGIERMDAPRAGAGIQGDVYFFERSKDMSGVCMAVQYRDPNDSPSMTFFALQ